MGVTPDRNPGGPDYESEVQFSDEGKGDPTVLGAMRYTLGAFRLRDAKSVFDVRRPWANQLDGPGSDLAGITFYKVVTGKIPVTRVDWFRDAAKTLRIIARVYSYLPAAPLLPATIVTTVYKADGVTPLRTCQDTISYSGVFESGRVRVFT